MKSVRVPLDATPKFPDACVCCRKPCGPSDRMELTLSPSPGVNKVYAIPACPFCQQHWSATNSFNRTTNFVFGAAALGALGYLATNRQQSIWMAVVVALVLVGIAKLILLALRPPKLTEPGHADPGSSLDLQLEPVTIRHLQEGKRDFAEFAFAHDAYAEDCARLNGAKARKS